MVSNELYIGFHDFSAAMGFNKVAGRADRADWRCVFESIRESKDRSGVRINDTLRCQTIDIVEIATGKPHAMPVFVAW